MSGSTIGGFNPLATLQGVSSGSAATGTTNVPPGILALPDGTLLRGEIIRADTIGNLILATSKGELSLKSELPIRVGNEIVLRLDTSTNGLKARIISVDGLTPRELEAARGAPAQPAQIDDIVDTPGTKTSPPPETSTQAARLNAQSVEIKLPQQLLLNAVLLSRSSELPLLLEQLPSSITIPPQRLEAGATFTLRLLLDSIQPPQQQPAQTPSASPASPTQNTTLNTSLPSPPATAAPTTLSAFSNFASLPSVMTPEQLNVAATIAAQNATSTPMSSGANTATPFLQQTPLLNQPAPLTTAQPPLIPQPSITPTSPSSSPPPAQVPTPSATIAPAAPQVASSTPSQPSSFAAPQSNNPAIASQQPNLLSQGLLVAEVIGTERSGETVLKTAMGILKLQLPQIGSERQALPVGTQMTFQIANLSPQSATEVFGSTQSGSAPASLAELSNQWNSLKEAAAILSQYNPAIAQQILTQAIPQPGPQMAATTLFFLSALRGGDVKQWLGKQAVEILENMNRGDLLQKLSSEFTMLRQFFTDSPAPNWQAAFVPVMDGQELQQARLYIKKQPPEQSSKDGGGTRFIMEVELSHLGTLQLDGFVRKQQQSTLFDLVLRSHIPLSENYKQDIRDIFTSASEITGFKGGISFQTAQPFPTLPMEEIIRHDKDVLA